MEMDKYHLVHKNDEWKLQREGSNRASKSFDTKSEAMKESTDFMRTHGGSLRIHKTDGQFQEERTYPRKADPRRSKG